MHQVVANQLLPTIRPDLASSRLAGMGYDWPSCTDRLAGHRGVTGPTSPYHDRPATPAG